MEHGVFSVSQNFKGTNRSIVGDQLTLVENQQTVCHGDHIFQSVLADQNRSAQFPVDTSQSLQKIRCRNGVQLACRLVQDQHIRLQHHNGCQVQKLFLTAGELGHFHVEPGLNAKEAGHFRNPSPNGSVIHPQAFQAESQLMPHLVGDDLAVRVLQDEANLGRLGAVVHCFQGGTVKKNGAFPFAVRRKNCFELPQHSGLAAAGGASKYSEVTGIQVYRNIPQNRALLLRVCKSQILDLKAFHFRSSIKSIISGRLHIPP